MPPRPYDNASRQLQQAELKSRIAAAAAELHASQGALATSYAQIAERAGVSLPTVYKPCMMPHVPPRQLMGPSLGDLDME